jgi:hypothetical protein
MISDLVIGDWGMAIGVPDGVNHQSPITNHESHMG